MNKQNIINGLFDAIENNLNNNLLLLEEINNSQLDQIDEIKNMIDDLIKDLFENFDLDIIDNSMEKNVEPITDAIKEFFIIHADNNSLEEIKESKIEESSNRIPTFEEQKHLGKAIPNFPKDSNEKNKKSSNTSSAEKEIIPFIKEINIDNSEEKNDVIKVSILSEEKYNNTHEISFSVNQSLECKKQNDFILKEDSPIKEFSMAKQTSNSNLPSKNNRPEKEKEQNQIKAIVDGEKYNEISEKNDIIFKNSPKKQHDEDSLINKESIKSENKMDNELQNIKSLKDFDKKTSNKIKNYNVYYSKSSNSKAIEELIKNTKLPEMPSNINTINNNTKDKKPTDKKTNQKETNKYSNKISNSIEKKNEKSEIKKEKEKDKNEKVDLRLENDKPMNESNLNSNNKNLLKKPDKNYFLLTEFNFDNKKNETEKKEKKLESEKKDDTKISYNISQTKNEKSSEKFDFPKNRKILSSFDFPSERKVEKQGEYSSCERNFKSYHDSAANKKREKNFSDHKDNTISEFTKIKNKIVNDDIISMPKETFSVQEDEGLSQELNTSKKNKEEINEKLFPKKFNSENKIPGESKKKKLLNYYYFFDEKKNTK